MLILLRERHFIPDYVSNDVTVYKARVQNIRAPFSKAEGFQALKYQKRHKTFYIKLEILIFPLSCADKDILCPIM